MSVDYCQIYFTRTCGVKINDLIDESYNLTMSNLYVHTDVVGSYMVKNNGVKLLTQEYLTPTAIQSQNS